MAHALLPDPLRGAYAALKVCNCRQLEPSMWPDPLHGARPVQTIGVLIKSLLAGAPELASPDWGPKGSISYEESARAPKVAPAGLGPEMVIFLLRILLPGAPEVPPAGLGPKWPLPC